ncbi:MAG: hypothetical protein CM1200mP14_26740 [Gammaproteobacteria bacterium]|nr:MAG: hypothetical protein CM1200mP14_26740 [Gammaproteobacteria bacterium]
MPMQMGVEITRTGNPLRLTLDGTSARVVAPPVPTANDWYAISAEVTRAYQAVNRC